MTTLQTLPSKQIIVAALRNTFIGDSKTLKDTTDFLAAASSIVGYSMSLMEIVDDASIAIDVKQAALVQLKNQIKLFWQSKKLQMNPQEKQSIKNAILLAVVRCNQNHVLIKIYKEIFTIIINHQYRNWLPVAPIIQRINQQLDLVPLLHILLAIAASFQFSITEQERAFFFNFLKAALPTLLQLLSKRQDHQLIYLCLKFLWKAVHYEISAEVKELVCQWMPLLNMVISATNPQFDANPEQTQTRDTSEFYYFHSKKWATRIFLRFLQRHAKKSAFNKNDNNRVFSENWYKSYGQHMVSALVQQFGINTVKKVRFFQLKCLQVCIAERPDIVKQYAEGFQYDVLLRYLRLQPEDEQLANSDPIEFLSKEEEPSLNFTNLKKVATDVWVGFAELGSKLPKNKQPYQAGIFFFKNMSFLQSKLQGTDQIQKQMAMYLICQLRSPIQKCKQVSALLPVLIAKYVIPEFQNPVMFLRARAVDIFNQYGKMELDANIVQQAVQGIYYCLTKDQHSIVRVKAASAFNCILKHGIAKNLVRPLLKQILTIYLQLLDKYDLQNIVISLESIVQNFAQEITPFTLQLVRHLSKLFYKLYSKDIEQNNQEEYDGEAELAAAGCLNTITRIIQSPIPQEIFPQLEIEVLAILEFIFGDQGSEYIEDGLILMNSYLFKAKQISNYLWFFFDVVVYNMVGIPKEMWESLDSLPFQEKQKAIFRNVKSGGNFEMIDQSMPVLRNYIQKASLLSGEPSHELMKGNIIRLTFYLIKQNYNKKPDEYLDESEYNCCTALLIYILENFQKNLPQVIYSQIWEIAYINIAKQKPKTLKVLNSQLISLLVWAAPIQILTIAHKQNLLPTLLHELTCYESKYEQQYERARLILGLNTLLLLPEKPGQILVKIPDLFKVLLKLVKKNAEDRLQSQPINNLDDDDHEQSEENIEDIDFDDDDDFWDEQYDDNYIGALDDVDQIAVFKQTIEKLNLEQNSFYVELIKIVPTQQLIALDEKVKKALQKIELLAN